MQLTNKINQNTCLMIVLTHILGCVDAHKTMSLLPDNGSMDQYYAPEGDASSEVTAATATSVAESESTLTTGAATETALETSSSSLTASESLAITDSSATSSESTTVWWTPATEATTTHKWWTPESQAAASTTHKWWTPESETVSSTKTTASAAPLSTFATTTAASTSASNGKCQPVWGQCGGADYSGATCCEPGLQCIHVNSYWARCVSASTLNSVAPSATGANSANGAHEQLSTYYGYSTVVGSATETFTNSAGKAVTTVVASTSVGRVQKGVSTVAEESSNAGVAMHAHAPAAAALAALALLL